MFESLCGFYSSGKTLPEDFRRSCLESLRHEVLKREDELLHALYMDLNKPASEAYASEVGFVLSEISYALKNLHKWMRPVNVKTPIMFMPARSRVIPSPKGVVLILGPWNYPFQLLFTPLVGAIAAGNCTVLKASRHTPFISKVMKTIIEEAFDPDQCRFVSGDEEGARELIDLKWDHIFFTGSTEVGRMVMEKASKNLTPVTLELGGKNPCIVFDDADLKVSAERIAWGKFLNAGQTCIAPDTVYCHEEIMEKFIEILKGVIIHFYGADPEKSPDFGRIINGHHVKRLASYLACGCRVVAGGRYDEDKRYFEPTVITDIPENAPVMNEEIFGPILPVIGFKDIEDIIFRLRDKSHPLALYIFTKNRVYQERLMQAIPSGSAGINETVKQGATHYLPFGGFGESGMGMYHGRASFEAFSHFKAVLCSSYRGTGFHYPPYGNTLKFLKKIYRLFG
ncbi:MAG: aldehyde dehydrogenase family protein [Deltaproteobacteria bacterium]|nr:aldehyde dehydrogenase family protein [Deltaproteobacteria bacterium]